MNVTVVETSSLGDRTYLLHHGDTAVVVDPQRDIDRVLAAAGRLGVRITHVAETHLHNDYVSGGLALSRLTGASYLVAAAEEVSFDRVPVAGGDLIDIGEGLRLRVIATPGHTFNHVAYAVQDGDRPLAVCTGGSLLYGTTGRTDLLGSSRAEELAYRQHASAHHLASLLPEATPVWPTHGFGSFCSVAPADVASSTIGRELTANSVVRLSASEFAADLIASLLPYPAYYAHMGARNAAGADPIDLSPVRRASPGELHDRLAAGEWVVDLRARKAFAYQHLAGSLSFGVDGPLATWLGWLLPPGTPVTLLGESPGQVAEAQRELSRIGIDRPAAAATGTPPEWGPTSSMRTATFAELRSALPGIAVLDVRRQDEWDAGHIAGAHHIPLPELSHRLGNLPPSSGRSGEPPALSERPLLSGRTGELPLSERLGELPVDTEIWVHCAAGYRAAAAASLLLRAGLRVVHVDDLWENAAAAGLTVAE
jgi:hydroxyacylglutathione hydrolase